MMSMSVVSNSGANSRRNSFQSCSLLSIGLVSAESANQFGELVADPETHELLHYTEKPETFVSDLINCGVYIFTPNINSKTMLIIIIIITLVNYEYSNKNHDKYSLSALHNHILK
ncbi:mannose-1-phosphate guanylyltransferase [Trifolium repens]|nr:mannose-1-phosphate guanylyltransferase [Trifolium repens]